MAPSFLYDLSTVDLNRVLIPLEDIRKIIPQRFEMEMLTAIVHYDGHTTIGFKDVTPQDFWVRGHIPGRPLMPGVLMIEAAAQICAYTAMRQQPHMGFMGFTKCDQVVFRGTVVPPARLYLIAQMRELSRRRAIGQCQGICNGNLVFQATITGMSV
jgi:3-hydroxyacyl-[acyl-carrier-protein] dehydratase